MKFFLTSFKQWDANPHPERWAGYSIAVYQPSWLTQLPKIHGFDIRDNGKWIRPRDFIPSGHDASKPSQGILISYRNALVDLYESRIDELNTQIEALDCEVSALCCWCPYDKAAKRQIEDYGSFICHSAAVEVWLKLNGHQVVRDRDREKMVWL